MHLVAGELQDFYASPLGVVARRILRARIRAIWPAVTGMRVLGYGFATPFLKPFRDEASHVAALMPAEQGVLAWPRRGLMLSALGEPDRLPFADAVFDRILVAHGLEGADAVRPLMRQLWRVLAPDGRILIVAPNRASLWAQVESSPFAVGRPFQTGELAQLLEDCLFTPEQWHRALYVPPLPGRLVRSLAGWERIGAKLYPRLGGVHIVEASKAMYASAPRGGVKARSVQRAGIGA